MQAKNGKRSRALRALILYAVTPRPASRYPEDPAGHLSSAQPEMVAQAQLLVAKAQYCGNVHRHAQSRDKEARALVQDKYTIIPELRSPVPIPWKTRLCMDLHRGFLERPCMDLHEGLPAPFLKPTPFLKLTPFLKWSFHQEGNVPWGASTVCRGSRTSCTLELCSGTAMNSLTSC